MDERKHWTHRFVSPFWACRRDAGSLDIPDCLYDSGTEYEQDIRRAIQEFHTEEYPSSDLMTYFSLPKQRKMEKAIRSKVHAARMDTCSIGGSLYAAVDLELSDDLTDDEELAFMEQLEKQFVHGWGAAFELVGIPVAGGQEIAVWLNHSGLNILPIEDVQRMKEADVENTAQKTLPGDPACLPDGAALPVEDCEELRCAAAVHEYWPHRLVASVSVTLIDAVDMEVIDCIYDDAAKYEQDIRHAMQNFQTDQYPSSDLMNYFSLLDAPEMEAVIREKVHAARLDVCSIGGKLYSAVDLDLSADLLKEEVAALTDQLEQQFKEGWGAEFELADVPVEQEQGIILAVRIGSFDPDMGLYPVEVAETTARMEAEGTAWWMGQGM